MRNEAFITGIFEIEDRLNYNQSELLPLHIAIQTLSYC
jgi:hypothetical protein